MSDLDQCYKVLGLEPGASPEEVNQAYKDLAFIWHPDRIPQDNARLRQKAQEKLKEINHARDRLRSIQPTTQNKNAQAPASGHPAPPRDSAKRTTTGDRKKSATSHNKSSSQSQYQARKPHSDLSGADFRGADLKERDFSGRNLSNANLSNANLTDAFLHNVNLQGANLKGANLFRANLLQANLSNACLRDTNLIGADFSGADLRGADLRGARIGSKDRVLVKLTGANLSGAILPDGTIYE
jgi:uncharacterized protein YjbI with pentapeptide repeats